VLEHASRASDDVRRRFELDLDDVCRSVKIIDHFKGNPSAAAINQATKGVVDSAFPFKCVSRTTLLCADPRADSSSAKPTRWRTGSSCIKRRWTSYRASWPTAIRIRLEVSLSRPGPRWLTPQAILPSLRAQHGLALSLAAKIAALHEDSTELRQVYAHLYKQKTGARDPFIEAGLYSKADVANGLGDMTLR
jgi:hypothetical protein